LVFGLGTRAVDRADDDYTRVVALNAPSRFPGADRQGHPRVYYQRKVDVLDLEDNELVTLDFKRLWPACRGIIGPPVIKRAVPGFGGAQAKREAATPLLDLSAMLEQTGFVEHMRQALAMIEAAYEHPVDVEFAANFYNETHYKLHLLQCRPFQFRGNAPLEDFPEGLPEDRVLFSGDGPVIGHSRVETLDRVVWVAPDSYGVLPLRERYAVARALGQVLRRMGAGGRVLLAGPGRWGTSTPALGVPVSFAEITNAAVLVEIVAAQGDLAADVSLGTHFFSEMIETEMLYVALYPDRAPHTLHLEHLAHFKVGLADYLDDSTRFHEIIHIADLGAAPLHLFADAVHQRAVCYWPEGAAPASS
jgi:pyruvate, water dikinase